MKKLSGLEMHDCTGGSVPKTLALKGLNYKLAAAKKEKAQAVQAAQAAINVKF